MPEFEFRWEMLRASRRNLVRLQKVRWASTILSVRARAADSCVYTRERYLPGSRRWCREEYVDTEFLRACGKARTGLVCEVPGRRVQE
jgi:hypothetical protein